MTKRKGNYVPGPGRDSFRKKHGSEPQPFKFLMTKDQHHFILSKSAALNISAAEYLRRLIEQDMERPKAQGE